MKHVEAIVENGYLKPVEPLGIDDGRRVELDLRLVPTPSEAEQDLSGLEETLSDIREGAAEYSQEWWDDFDRDLRENRLNFEERF
jgi:predicted DNA-binding antitoxin AbrB/MazE fold protein